MGCLRPATPGFLVTLIATILLAVVSFNTPLLKSISFLEATITVDNVKGTIRLGTLGYCLELSSNGTTCSSPAVGYTFDINSLLDNDTRVQIPNVVADWITKALFLHVIALCFAAGSALFGLLAHVREMSMTCCSTCISGFAAVVALVAFIFDIVLFFLVKKRVEDIDGTATFGIAVWLTLAAWILLFFSGCVYACGRCCVSRRSRGSDEDPRMDKSWMGRFGRNNDPSAQYADQMRLDAVKAEADRKARQKNEIGLPAFPSQEDAYRPLRGGSSEDDVTSPYRDAAAMGARPGGPRRQGSASTGTTAGPGQGFKGGYAQGAPGTRAVDEYYTPSPASPAPSNAHSMYPPQRQYTGSPALSPPAMPGAMPGVGAGAAAVAAGAGAGYFAANHGPSSHDRYASSAATYGHTPGGSSYHTAESSHQQYPSTGAGYADPYSPAAVAMPMAGAYTSQTHTPPPQQSYADPYYSQNQNQGAYGQSNTYGAYDSANNAYGANEQSYGYGAGYNDHAQSQPERSYTLGGGAYGSPSHTPSPQPASSGATGGGAAYSSPYGTPGLSSSPPPMPTATGAPSAYPAQTGAVQGTRQESYEEGPPGYEAGANGSTAPAVHVPAWGSKT